jgi:hypothetical protein
MRSILRYGQYGIGFSDKSAQNIGDLISLELHPPNDLETPPCQLKYNLDELHDLQSKLVLITGSKADNRTEVDHFLDVSDTDEYYTILLALHLCIDLTVCYQNRRYTVRFTTSWKCKIYWMDYESKMCSVHCYH